MPAMHIYGLAVEDVAADRSNRIVLRSVTQSLTFTIPKTK